MSVEISGLEMFDEVVVRVRAKAEKAVRETVEAIRDGARARAPVDTGATKAAIASSVTVRGDVVTGEVHLGDVVHHGVNWFGAGSGALNKGWENFGLWLEYGTRYRRATPFLTPAAEAERENFQKRLADAVESAVRE